MSRTPPEKQTRVRSTAIQPPEPHFGTQSTAQQSQPNVGALVQRAVSEPRLLRPGDVRLLHAAIGNRAVQRLLMRATDGGATGLPGGLRAGVEALGAVRMDDVSVTYDSPEPARLGALAYTRGAEIHLGPGQEQHLPHEAWHVVQQKQGRVAHMTQAKGLAANADARLEREADEMGAKAARLGSSPGAARAMARQTRDAHGRGCGCGSCSPAAAGTVQFYRHGYVPRLADGPRAPNGVHYSRAGFGRPNAFDDATIVQVYQEAQQQVHNNPADGTPEVYYRCASCHRWKPYEAMQIGHIENWAAYVEDKVPADTAEARDAYNDLDNLYLQCSTCNQGHAFEEAMDEDYDKRDPFVDDSDKDPEHDKRAFDMLHQHLHGTIGYHTH